MRLWLASLGLVAILTASLFAHGGVSAEEEEEAVKIAGHKTYIDDSNLVHIVGIVENTGILPVGFVHVTASLADEKGNPLPAYNTITLVRTVLPGRIAPFNIPISDKYISSKVASYDLSIKWNIVDPMPDNLQFSGISAFTVTHNPMTAGYMGEHREAQFAQQHEAHAHSEASGYVTNTGKVQTKSVRAIVVWYDKEGEFYGLDWQIVGKKLAPGESGRFVFMTHPLAMGYYSVIAESDAAVAMLEQDGRKKIPVYEAPRSNIEFASITNAMSISEVRIVDESNQPVSDIEPGEMVMLQSVMKNNMKIKQRFISIYQIKDSSGSTAMIFWMSSQIPAQESLDTAISWIPEADDNYTLQIFLWESLLNPVPLGDFSESLITVSS